jgi:hypothetical protein
MHKMERAVALEQLISLRKQLVSLESELEQYGACDPVKIEEKKRAVVLAHEATIRWTGENDLRLFCGR